MVDLWGAQNDWVITLARDGDRQPLVELLGSNDQIAANIRRFLADVLEGKCKLKPRKKLTFEAKRTRYLREKWVLEQVKWKMREQGKQRDKLLRKKFIQNFAQMVGTTESAVLRYQHQVKSRRS